MPATLNPVRPATPLLLCVLYKAVRVGAGGRATTKKMHFSQFFFGQGPGKKPLFSGPRSILPLKKPKGNYYPELRCVDDASN